MAKKQQTVYEIRVKGLDDIKSLNTEISKLNGKYDALGKETKKASDSTKSIGDTAKGSTMFVGKMTKAFGAATIALVGFRQASKFVVQQLKEGFKVFKGYQFEMAKVKAISGATKEEFEQLNKSAQDLGRSTFFTAEQVAGLQLNFSKLGFTASEVLEVQEAALLGATATGEDLARTATVIGSTVRGFGLDASEGARVADVMAASFTQSALTLEKFQTSMTKVSPVAKLLGMDLEETTSIMGVLTDAGIEASIAGTSLRNIFLKLGDPSSDLAKSIGFTVNSGEDMVKEFRRMRDEGIDVEKMLEVVDVRQVAAISTMIEHIDKIEKQTEAYRGSAGAAGEMADIIGDNVEGALRRFNSALDGLRIVIADLFAPALQSTYDALATLFNNIALSVEGFDSLEDKIASSAKESRVLSENLTTLKDRYNTLNQQTKKSRKEHLEMETILIDLQNELGNSVVRINDETGALQLNSDALDEVIERHALLADKEALKLARQLRKLQKDLKSNSSAQDDLAKKTNTAKQALNEASKTTDDLTKSTINAGGGMQVLGDMEGNVAEETQELTNRNKEFAEQQNRVNNLTGQMTELKLEGNKLLDEEKRLKELLLEAGFDEASINTILIDQEKKKQELSELKKGRTPANDDAGTEPVLDELSILQTQVDAFYVQLFKDLDLNTLSIEKAQKEHADFQTTMIQSMLKDDSLSYETRMALEKKLIDLKMQNFDKEKAGRQEVLNQMKNLGQTLIMIGEAEGENNKVKQLGIKISQAAAVASSIEAASNAINAITDMAADSPWYLKIANILALVASFASVGLNVKQLLSGGQGASGGNFDTETDVKFEQGGLTRGGMFQGNSHANGGVKFRVGGRIHEAEGGEAIINKKSTSVFRPVLSAINSYNGNGVKFADGGLLNSGEKFAMGGELRSAQQLVSGGMGSSKVVIVESDMTEVQNRISAIESQATF